MRGSDEADAPGQQTVFARSDAVRWREARAQGSVQGISRQGRVQHLRGHLTLARGLTVTALSAHLAPLESPAASDLKTLSFPAGHQVLARGVLLDCLLCRVPRLAAPSLGCPEPAAQGLRCITFAWPGQPARTSHRVPSAAEPEVSTRR